MPGIESTDGIASQSSDMMSESLKTASAILDIISKYRLTKLPDANDNWSRGLPKFLEAIERYVKTKDTIRMALPAFPFKSANKVEKVLGALPDRAEEVSLSFMNSMCVEIIAIYKPGAKLLIISDGLVYNDLFSIPDKEVWAYGEAIRSIAQKTCPHIEFSRLKDICTIKLPTVIDEVSYVANATNFRRALLNEFGRDDLDVREQIKVHEDTKLTYLGYTRFLSNDLRFIFPVEKGRTISKFKRDVKLIAREMIARGYAFAAAVNKNFPDHLRLSIHQSTGEHKISVTLLPTTTSYTTPWHCAIAYKADGTLTSAPAGDFHADPRYSPVIVSGREYYFKERDDTEASADVKTVDHSADLEADGSKTVALASAEDGAITIADATEDDDTSSAGASDSKDENEDLAPSSTHTAKEVHVANGNSSSANSIESIPPHNVSETTTDTSVTDATSSAAMNDVESESENLIANGTDKVDGGQKLDTAAHQ